MVYNPNTIEGEINQNNDVTGYAAMLSEASENWGISPEQIEDNMKRIAYHESQGDPTSSQERGKEGQLGKGLYQFETGHLQGGHTAATRLKRHLGYTPEDTLPEHLSWLNVTDEGFDASNLSPEQQNMLFLANYMKKANPEGHEEDPSIFSSGMSGIGADNIDEWWAQQHWAGKAEDKEARLASFNKDMETYGTDWARENVDAYWNRG